MKTNLVKRVREERVPGNMKGGKPIYFILNLAKKHKNNYRYLWPSKNKYKSLHVTENLMYCTIYRNKQ